MKDSSLKRSKWRKIYKKYWFTFFMDTLEKTVFDSVMSRYGTLYCQFEATSSSVAELHRNYRELLSVLNPYKRNVNNIGGYRGILEKTAIELANTINAILKILA